MWLLTQQFCVSGRVWKRSVMEIQMPGTLLVLTVTVHMLDDRGTVKVCLIGVQLSITTCHILQWRLVSFPHQLWGGTCGDKYGPLDNMHPVSKRWICVLEQKTAWCWGTICTGWERVMRWDVLGSGGWVSHKHCIRKVYSGNVCVRLIWIYCLETWSPATTGHGHVSSVFTISGVCGWNFFLPLNVKSYFWLCVEVSPCLTRSVSLDSFLVVRRL
jgi:hypothetical protein